MVSRDVCGYEPDPAMLDGWRFVRRVVSWSVTDSTNARALEMARRREAGPGTLLLAGEQTAGRGRVGHDWHSAPDTGVYATLVLAPADFQPKGAWGVSGGASRDFQPGWLTLAAGVAVHRALSALIGPDAEGALDLKWPNDVLWNGRKVCGILAESEAVDGGIAFVVLGIGINVGQERFPDAIRDRAVSLRTITGIGFSRRDVLARVLDALDAALAALAQGRAGGVLAEWERRSTYARGRRVEARTPGGALRGVTDGLDPDGALRLRAPDGTVHLVHGGEIVDWA
ncbi:MAG: biotin--[acetyl-CoA-carboxylase] ligase [Acidobacteria bacterium]|nr:biotin--[acetyl-CoA-carboxylase] ligase [Acidobacteriota bacterium]